MTPDAPMIRSSKPSPLTSPADATETPLTSKAAPPVNLKPSVPFRLDRSVFAEKPEALPNTTSLAPV